MNKTSIEGTKDVPGFAFYLANGVINALLIYVSIAISWRGSHLIWFKIQTYWPIHFNDVFSSLLNNASICIMHYQQCDLVLGGIGITNPRIFLVDLSAGYLFSSVSFVIPMPNSENNIAAVVKPFQIRVKSIFSLVYSNSFRCFVLMFSLLIEMRTYKNVNDDFFQ